MSIVELFVVRIYFFVVVGSFRCYLGINYVRVIHSHHLSQVLSYNLAWLQTYTSTNTYKCSFF